MRSRRKKAEQTDSAELPVTPPKGLDKTGQEVWRWAVETCAAAGRPLQELHRVALLGLCDARADATSSGDIIEKEGVLIDGGREGMKRHPATSIRSQALTIARAYLAELGLTPTSSSRLPAKVEKPKDNPFASLRR